MTDSAPEPLSPVEEAQRELLAQCLDRVAERGLPAALALLQAHPEHAQVVRERLRKLHQAGLLPEPEAADSIPERLGEFRLLRRLGAGGMGVVYLAQQESLGREVALKLVRPEQLFFPGARERFRREVDAIARLNDPGIVPIHTVGEDGGIPYFAMEFVAGATLAEVLASVHDRRPDTLGGRDVAVLAAARAAVAVPEPLPEAFQGTWVQTVCRLVARMALAVHHAHERGVLHRDLKPSNVMVTATGRALLLDFGLASAAGTTRLTRTGSQPGTLHYMAPEQLRGEAVDARTDVYGLGATLFELLALRVPFHADSSEGLRQAILAGDLPGHSLRGLGVPRDVDTICRAAMDRDPARRYATAAALAEDLQRFLEHRPIAARPAGVLLHARRWARRHPGAASVVGLVLAVGAVTPWLQRDRARLKVTAQQNLEEALGAISQLLAQANSDVLRRTPGIDLVRAQQFDLALSTLERLRRENDGHRGVRHSLALGLVQAAQLQRSLGRVAAAEGSLAVAQEELERLLAESPEEPGYRADLAATLLSRGISARERGDLTAAAASWRRGITLLEARATQPQVTPRELHNLSSCRVNLGLVLQSQGNLDGAEQELRAALALDARQSAVDLPRRIEQATVRHDLAALLRKRGKLDLALAEFEQLRALHTELLAKAPKEPECRRALARACYGIALVQLDRGDRAAAQAAQDQALGLFEELVAAFPERSEYQWERSMTEFQAASMAAARSELAAAEALYRRAVAHHEALVKAQPQRAELRAELGAMLDEFAVMLGHTEHDEECQPLFERAVALQREALGQHPEDVHYRTELGTALSNLGLHHLHLRDANTATALLREAVDHYERALAAGGASVREPGRLPNALTLLAQVASVSGDRPGAVSALARWQELTGPPRAALRTLGRRFNLLEQPEFVALLARVPQ